MIKRAMLCPKSRALLRLGLRSLKMQLPRRQSQRLDFGGLLEFLRIALMDAFVLDLADLKPGAARAMRRQRFAATGGCPAAARAAIP